MNSTPMSDGFSLAARLRALDNDRLRFALSSRDIRTTGIKDFFDLAETLLDRASIQQQLSRLDRGTLAAIAAAAELGSTVGPATDVATFLGAYGDPRPQSDLESRLQRAVDLLLAQAEDGRFTVYQSVAEQLRSWPAFGLPGLAELAASPPPPVLEPVADTELRFIDRVAAERAFAATTEITELLVELEREPARELAKGGVALPDTKRLANAMSVDLGSVARLLSIAADAALVAREGGVWLITDTGGAWLLLSSGERWRALAAGWFQTMPADVRTLLGERGRALWGDGFRAYVDWLFPAGGDWMDERIAGHSVAAEQLGITANQSPSGPGSALFTEGPDAAARLMAALLPREVAQVYLQHDLSIVAPGPLAPEVDYRLRSLADSESRTLASTYRVSASSMNRAMAAGETAATVREFLKGISLSGIPQPLDYLISEASVRYGLLRVGAADVSPADAEFAATSYVRSDDTALLGTVLVDQNLSALGLIRAGENRLVSRFSVDTVFWNLSDARYPVAAENPAGEIVALRRRRHARSTPPSESDPIAELIERLRLGGESEPGEPAEAWLTRQLDAAIRVKAALTVSVTMPNGAIVDYQLEPTSIAGGRLRARDRRSAIERTLPLSSIAAVAPADDVS
ncbi:MAG: hypothetical protein JWL94_424 [Microbacteriaceae bacterium]|jgi:hypothetical protein|nr:hypothetical protein [Microbacteriaceae bacterium]HEV7956403.1 helicase-associated domain-containing protein [Marisediminicola sp.]